MTSQTLTKAQNNIILILLLFSYNTTGTEKWLSDYLSIPPNNAYS